MTFPEVENLLKETTHTSYPVVVSREHPYIVGQVQRRVGSGQHPSGKEKKDCPQEVILEGLLGA